MKQIKLSQYLSALVMLVALMVPMLSSAQGTGCNAYQSVPYSIDFTQEADNTIPQCWQSVDTCQGFPRIYTISNYMGDGSTTKGYYLYTNATAGDHQYTTVVTPRFQNLNTRQITFTASYPIDYVQPELFLLGTWENNTFTTIDTLTISRTPILYTIYLDGYTGTAEHLAFRIVKNSGHAGICIQNFELSTLPSCYPPLYLAEGEKTTSSVVVDWTMSDTSIHSWYMVYDTIPITDPDNHTATTVNTKPFTVTGLEANTEYYFRMKSNCGANHISSWSQPLRAKTNKCDTLCNVIIEKIDGSSNAYVWDVLALSVDVYQGEDLMGRSSDYSGSLATVPVCKGQQIEFRWSRPVSGAGDDYAERASFNIMDNYEEDLYSCTNINLLTDGQTFYTYTPDCLPPACFKPRQLHVSQITATQAMVTWQNTGADTYQVVYGPANSTEQTTLNVTGDTVMLTNLLAGTPYVLSLQGMCTEGNSVIISTSFNTGCATISTLPYTQNFNYYGNNETPLCWSMRSNSADYAPKTSTLRRVGTTGAALRMQSSPANGNYAYAILPELTTTNATNALMLSFRMLATTLSCGTVEVGVMSDPENLSSFTSMGSVAVSSANVFENFDYALMSYTGTGRYIALRANTTDSVCVYIDNVVVSVTPSCYLPYDVTLSQITHNSMQLSWSAYGNNLSYEYLRSTTPLDNPETASNVQTTTATSAAITGLQPNTTYYFYVKTNCSATNYSGWTFAESATTLCAPQTDLPYVDHFENGQMPACWNVEYVSGQTDWVFGQSGSALQTYNQAQDGQHNLSMRYVEAGATTKLVLPMYALNPNRSYQLNFWYLLPGLSSSVHNSLKVYYRTSPVADWTLLSEINELANSWRETTIDLLNPTSTYQVAFEGSIIENGTSGIGIDNLWMGETPTCVAINPSDITFSQNLGDQVTVSWTEPTTAQSWDVICTTQVLMEPGEYTDIQHVTSNPFVLEGLNPKTHYYLYIKANCDAQNQSRWSRPAQFSTQCVEGTVTNYPYSEDFEMGIDCWAQENLDGNRTWQLSTGCNEGIRTAHGGQYNAAITSASATPSQTMLCSPVFDLSASTNAYVKFSYVIPTWVYDHDTLGLYVRMDGANGWTRIKSYAQASETWRTDSVALPSTPGTLQIGFLAGGMYGYGIGIDDVTVDAIGEASCDQPVLGAVNVTMDDFINGSCTAEVNWSGNASGYQLTLRSPITDSWCEYINTSSTTHTFLNLQPGTTYDYRVRVVCGQNGYSYWTIGTFATPDLPCAVPQALAATDITDSSATLTWQSSQEHASWIVNLYSYNSLIGQYTTTQNRLDLNGLIYNTTYSATVKAFCGDATVFESHWSETLSFTTDTIANPMLSISTITNSGHLAIYPNPTTTQTTLSVTGVNGKVEVLVINLNGIVVRNFAFDCDGACMHKMEVNNLPEGVYFVEIRNNGLTEVKKLIVK